MPVKPWLGIAALNGALAVAAGAFAAHGLKGTLAPDMLEAFKTGAQYHLSHALAMGLAALVPGILARCAAWLFMIGIVLFCGSLYLLALTGVHGLGVVTPCGGVAFIAGWLCLAVAGFKARD
ncbi:MAG: DUF423 domain-containing protein [Rhizomicrobium sp.]|nr:DUF423 domain-containing protein [Rhizomicrobium sp.]